MRMASELLTVRLRWSQVVVPSEVNVVFSGPSTLVIATAREMPITGAGIS